MFSRRRLLSALPLLPAARLLGRQTPNYTADVKLVTVFATVREKSSSRIVTNLTRNNFTVDEEGKTQTIRFFETESSLPLNLGLCVDTGESQGRAVGDERRAGFKLFDRILRQIVDPGTRSKDQAFVLHFDSEIQLLQEFTSSRDKLEKALDLLEVAPSRGRSLQPDGARLHDAILQASELMAKQQGRKALVLLTGGVDTGSRATLPDAIGVAQKADTLVYPLLLPNPGRPEDPDGTKALQQISDQTGGRFFPVGTFHQLDKVFEEIEEELRNQYNIGYTPDPPAEAGLYRRLHVIARMKKKELVVQARAGYYAR